MQQTVYKIYDGSEYVLSGGSIFILFAGVLCYINSDATEIHALNQLNVNLRRILGDDYDNFRRDLGNLFRNQDFIGNIRIILSGASDLDFIFMTHNDDFVTFRDNGGLSKKISNLSAKVLHSLLMSTLREKGVPITEKMNETHWLFPFFDYYSPTYWSAGALYDSAQMDAGLKAVIRRDISGCTGMRQTSNFMRELPIYLNRIKQGYFALYFNGDGAIYNDYGVPILNIIPIDIRLVQKTLYDEHKGKYAEGIDLVIGSRTSDLFRGKHFFYKQGKYYTIANFNHELTLILDKGMDDKSTKRIARQAFLNSLNDSPYGETYDYILQQIGIMIHS